MIVNSGRRSHVAIIGVHWKWRRRPRGFHQCFFVPILTHHIVPVHWGELFYFSRSIKIRNTQKKPCTKLFPKIKFWHNTITGELKYGFQPDRSAAAAVRLLITHIGDQLAGEKNRNSSSSSAARLQTTDLSSRSIYLQS